MSIEKVENNIKKEMGNLNVEKQNDIPFSSYDKFLNLKKKGVVEISSDYDTDLVMNFGDKAEIILHYFLIISPLISSIICLVTAFVFSNYWLLAGIVLALVGGYALSNPAFVRSIGGFVMACIFIYFCYSLFMQNWDMAILTGSYVIPNFLVTVGRAQCRMIVENAVLTSELVFCYLFKTKAILVSEKN